MVAYGFRPFLVEPIEGEIKIHTLRLGRKNPHAKRAHVGGHALPGEELQLYVGMRQPTCRLIGRATCVRTIRITVELVHSWVDLYETPGKKPRRLDCYNGSHIELDPFARADGFKDWLDFYTYWDKHIPPNDGTDIRLFDGWLIEWSAFIKGGKSGRKK
jgi:hypothetical protein